MRGEITETITARAGTADLLQTIVQGLPAPNILITEIKKYPNCYHCRQYRRHRHFRCYFG